MNQSFVNRCQEDVAFANRGAGILDAMERREVFLDGIEEALRARGEATPCSRRKFLERFYDALTPEKALSLPADIFILQSDLRAALSPTGAGSDAWASTAIRFDVYLDEEGAALLAKADRVREASGEAGSRLVAANLNRSRLQRVSRERIGSLRHHLDVDDRDLLTDILARVRECMPTRNSVEGPFHGVLAEIGERKPRRIGR